MTQVVSLPTLPTDSEFEDFVAAHLQSAGFYIEKSIIDRDVAEVLELDIVFTGYRADEPPTEKLIEVKSGRWGFGDIFKLSGWGKYLGINDLHLVIAKENDPMDFYGRKAADIGVDLIVHSNDASGIRDSTLLKGRPVDPLDVSSWRFSYWIERELQKALKHKKKSHQDMKCYACLDDYFYTLNSGIFFSKDVALRASKLYEAYKSHPHMTAKLAHELAGEDFDEDHKFIPSDLFSETFYDCKFTDLTVSTYVEHRARLAILKSAVDFSLFKKHEVNERIQGGALQDLLPTTFVDGLEEISKDSHFHLYPVFWQHFLWLLGGFIMEDYRESEYNLLSIKTGVPIDEIDNALDAYDTLFPIPDGWFKKADQNSKITFMRMMPPPFMGIGANYRKRMYTDNDAYASLKLSGKYTLDNLIRWNDCAVDVLTQIN